MLVLLGIQTQQLIKLLGQPLPVPVTVDLDIVNSRTVRQVEGVLGIAPATDITLWICHRVDLLVLEGRWQCRSFRGYHCGFAERIKQQTNLPSPMLP